MNVRIARLKFLELTLDIPCNYKTITHTLVVISISVTSDEL